MSDHIICLGSSAASLACAAQVRRLQPTIPITIITAQTTAPHNLCLLADYVAGQRNLASLYLPVPPGVTISYNQRVTDLNPVTKTVAAGAHSYPYTKLFIGTGQKPRIPHELRSELYTRVFPFKTLDDILAWQQVSRTNQHILVLGGGPTGIEAACALRQAGHHVTLAEQAERLLPRYAAQTAYTIQALFQHHDITLVTSQKPLNISRFDTLFLALGGTPVTEYAQQVLEHEHGYLRVDRAQRTSDQDIFAGGDCVIGRGLWSQAVRDGIVAAYGLLGLPAPDMKAFAPKTVLTIFGVTFTL